MIGLLGPLVRAAGIAALKNEAQATARRVGRNVALGAAFGVLVLLAFGFALAAFTVWLAGEIGTIPALGVVALAFLVLAIAVRLIATLSAKPRRRREPPPAFAEPLRAAASGAPPMGSELGSMAVIAIVGFILARELSRK